MWISWNMGQIWSSRSVLCGQIWHWPICGEYDIICSKQDGTNWNMWEHLQITEQLRDFCSSSLFFRHFSIWLWELLTWGHNSHWIEFPTSFSLALKTFSTCFCDSDQIWASAWGSGFRRSFGGFPKIEASPNQPKFDYFCIETHGGLGILYFRKTTLWWILLPVSGTNRSSMTCSVAFGLRAAFACAAWRPYNLGSEKRISMRLDI